MVAPEYELLPAITHKGTDAVCELHGLLQTISGTVQDIHMKPLKAAPPALGRANLRDSFIGG